MFDAVRWTEWSEEHIALHHVTPYEVEEVLFDPPRWTTPGRDGTTLVYGTTDAGRRLIVVVTTDADGTTFIITARPMNESEQRTFMRKAK